MSPEYPDCSTDASPRAHIGWIGTGVMGRSMVTRLLAAGYPVTLFTRTRARAESLLAEGAAWVEHPSELAVDCDVIVTMVGYPADVEALYLGERGLVPTLAATPHARARLLVDMTTSSPELAERIAARAPAPVTCLDAPVSGGDIGARNGTLSIMAGGEPGAFEALRPLFEHLGKTLRLQGPAGAGQHTKMVNQTLIATNMIGMCEGLLYAEHAGLDPRLVLESVSSGAAGSWSVSNLAPRILDEDFEPGFYVEHFLKDMSIALAEAERMHLPLPGLALARQLFEAVRARGLGRKGTQALYLALARLAPPREGSEAELES